MVTIFVFYEYLIIMNLPTLSLTKKLLFYISYKDKVINRLQLAKLENNIVVAVSLTYIAIKTTIFDYNKKSVN